MAQHTHVTVNFNVDIDASGNITVFGKAPPSPVNRIVSKTVVGPVALFGFNNTAGLIEFWEPSTDLGNIYCKLADSPEFNDSTGKSGYQATSKLLWYGLQKVLTHELDCSAAYPFVNDPKYTGMTDYTTNSDFGRFALSVYADALFGHAAATAAITNDSTFMQNMLSLESDEYVKARPSNIAVSDWQTNRLYNTKSATFNMVMDTPIANWDGTQSNADANLAVALVKAIIKKGTDAPISSIAQPNQAGVVYGDDTLANIVAQVIGQDASRAMGQDNNALAPDMHQLLRFYSGDTIFVNIKLQAPHVSISPGSTTNQQAYSGINTAYTYSDENYNYTLQITLGNPPAPPPPALNTISEQPTSITYDSVGQKIVLTYSSSSVVDVIEYLFFDYMIYGDWVGWQVIESQNLVKNGATIEIPNITTPPHTVQVDVKFKDIDNKLYSGAVDLPGPFLSPITITNVDRVTGEVTYNSTDNIDIQALINGSLVGGAFFSGAGNALTVVVNGIKPAFSNAGDTLKFARASNTNYVLSNIVTLE